MKNVNHAIVTKLESVLNAIQVIIYLIMQQIKQNAISVRKVVKYVKMYCHLKNVIAVILVSN